MPNQSNSSKGVAVPQTQAGSVRLSLVAPAHNEQENIAGLVEQAGRAFAQIEAGGNGGGGEGGGGGACELVIVDDGSTDGTRAAVVALMPGRPWLRCVAMIGTPPGRGLGQSAAFHAGVRASRGELVATIDADLQNDPSDLVRLLELQRTSGAALVQGDRSRARKDNAIRRVSSRVGRLFRRVLLGDRVRDTGCSLRVMTRELALRLPLEFRGMHRFVPAHAAAMGYRVIETPVAHRARTAGVSKYGLGIVQRAIPGLMDCLAVRWMNKRRRGVRAGVIEPGRAEATAALAAEVGAVPGGAEDGGVVEVVGGVSRGPGAGVER